MAAGKFGSGGSKMTMKVASAGTSSSARAGPSKQNGAARRGNKAATPDSDSEDAMDDADHISLEGGDDYDDDEPDTEDEIEAAKGAGSKSKKTAKRKRRATSPTSFGNALEGLLGIAPSTSAQALDTLDEAASDDDDDEEATAKKSNKKAKPTPKTESSAPAILSLAPHLRRSAQSTTLSARAARIALEQKRRREERCHVKDVITGWGPPGVLPALEDDDGNIIESTYPTAADDAERLQEFASEGGTQTYERKLRKVAQRGVVKLFNAIRAAQTTTEDDLQQAEAKKSAAAAAAATKASSAAAGAAPVKKAGLASKDARLADLSKSNFLDLIKKSSSSSSKSKGGVAAK